MRKTEMPYLSLAETESDYLITSRREKCARLLSQPELHEEDMIELYIALHVVLEVGLNALLRRITLWHAQPAFDRREVINQVDDINFKDKTALFLYYGHFNFGQKTEQAKNHQSILKKMAHFSEIRNQLLHGHSISTFILEGQAHDSSVRRKMNPKTLAKQIGLFRDIIQGMIFYLECLDLEGRPLDKEELRKKYLDLSFLEKTKFN